MNTPDNFGLDLASRLAVHEALLENLYTNLLRKMPDAQERWKNFEELLTNNLKDIQLSQESQTPEERKWLEMQRDYAQHLAKQFTARVAANQDW